MVTTRSGAEVGRRIVRFRKGSSIRRILVFDHEQMLDVVSNDSAIQKESTPDETALACSSDCFAVDGSLPKNTRICEQEMQNGDVLNLEYMLHYPKLPFISILYDTLVFILLITGFKAVASIIYKVFGFWIYIAVSTLSIFVYVYNITYYDSAEVGFLTPSLTSVDHRVPSSHVFHMNYITSFLCAVMFFMTSGFMVEGNTPPV